MNQALAVKGSNLNKEASKEAIKEASKEATKEAKKETPQEPSKKTGKSSKEARKEVVVTSEVHVEATTTTPQPPRLSRPLENLTEIPSSPSTSKTIEVGE